MFGSLGQTASATKSGLYLLAHHMPDDRNRYLLLISNNIMLILNDFKCNVNNYFNHLTLYQF